MKKAFAVIILLALVLTGCDSRNHADSTNTEAFQINSYPTLSTEVTEVTEGMDTKPTEEKLIPTETDSASEKEDSTLPTGSAEESTIPSTSKPDPTNPNRKDDPSHTGLPQEETLPATQPTTEPVPPTQAETVPSETESTTPETEPTEPITTPTEPITEPTGCAHEWNCIHHAEEGHWIAGIICDCGWTVYGDPGELTSLWNAHSASFSLAESLFDHGGFGSMDEWIVDKPAYDEWVCRLCGESKE